MADSNNLIPEESDFLLYKTPGGEVGVEVFFQDETVWLTINKMADLFDTTKQNISYHLQNIYKEKELEKKATVKEILTVQNENGRNIRRKLEHYSLDAIIAVGYRINSARATQFRIWATKILREYMIKGFVLDDERLKNGQHFGKDYFEDLLERIREIRVSERRFYQKITDIYTTSVDYDANNKTTLEFFSTVQNKMHWAISGQTAAEIIARRADSKKPHIGLTTWKHSPKGQILKSDVSVAKNYLNKKEIDLLDRIVEMYLIYAETQAKHGRPMKMKDWVEKLDAFLKFNEYEILDNPGKISHEVAKKLAEKEYAKYRIVQDQEFISDFDRETQKYLRGASKKSGK